MMFFVILRYSLQTQDVFLQTSDVLVKTPIVASSSTTRIDRRQQPEKFAWSSPFTMKQNRHAQMIENSCEQLFKIVENHQNGTENFLK